MAAEGRSCSASALAVQVWRPLALVTEILRGRSAAVRRARRLTIVVRGATCCGRAAATGGAGAAVTSAGAAGSRACAMDTIDAGTARTSTATDMRVPERDRMNM